MSSRSGSVPHPLFGMKPWVFTAAALLCGGLGGSQPGSEGFECVTWGSVIKLYHPDSRTWLSSDPVNYGASGSGQQVVSGSPDSAANSLYWVVSSQSHRTAEPVLCGSTITLLDHATKFYLHSHKIPAPFSEGYEVSAFNGHDSGDDWVVQCDGERWKRGERVRFLHKQTGRFLMGNKSHTYSRPLNSHVEVSTSSRQQGSSSQWSTDAGYFFGWKDDSGGL